MELLKEGSLTSGLRCGQVDTHDESRGVDKLMELVEGSRARAEVLAEGATLARSKPSQIRQVVIVEDFILRQRTQSRDLLSPVRIGARLADRLHVASMGEPIWQQPSDAKSIVTDKRMKAWDIWQPGQPHACDAIRHLLLWLRKQ